MPRDEGGDENPCTSLIPPHFYAFPKPCPVFPTSYVVVCIFVQSVDAWGDVDVV